MLVDAFITSFALSIVEACRKSVNTDELTERIVIEYANIIGRDSEHRAEFRQTVNKLITQTLALFDEALEKLRKEYEYTLPPLKREERKL